MSRSLQKFIWRDGFEISILIPFIKRWLLWLIFIVLFLFLEEYICFLHLFYKSLMQPTLDLEFDCFVMIPMTLFSLWVRPFSELIYPEKSIQFFKWLLLLTVLNLCDQMLNFCSIGSCTHSFYLSLGSYWQLCWSPPSTTTIYSSPTITLPVLAGELCSIWMSSNSTLSRCLTGKST